MWLPGQYAYDPHIVQLLPGAPPGDYTVIFSVFDRATLAPASALGPDGNPMGPDVTLGTVLVMSPEQVPDLRALEVPEDAVLQRCGPLGLWSMAADREQAAPGEVVGLRWVWEAVDAPPSALTATLTLSVDSIDQGGEDASNGRLENLPHEGRLENLPYQWALPPVAAWWPTDRWQAGERWVGRHVVRLPGGLESGRYRLAVTLPSCGETRLAAVELDVIAPDRVWEIPADVQSLDVRFGEAERAKVENAKTESGAQPGVVRLAGYALEPETVAPGAMLRVRLVWQALAEMETSYRVFVHLVAERAEVEHAKGHPGAEGGQVWAQSDGEPVAWTRPTTGWAVGEVVVDDREITLPAAMPGGTYRLLVGLYAPDGARLLTEDGADTVLLAVLSTP